MKRVFAAIVPKRTAVEALAGHIKQLREVFPDARTSWVRPENIHLTLHFAGEVDDAGLERLQEHVEAVAAKTPAFDARLGEAGAFVDSRLGRSVLWVGLEEVGGAEGATAKAAGEIRVLGGEKGKRFVPHLTLARVRGIAMPELLEANRSRPLSHIEFRVSEFVVFESELSRGGPVYKVLSRHRLSEPPALAGGQFDHDQRVNRNWAAAHPNR